MSNRLTKIYTRTGDKGTTSLGNKERVSKDDARVSAYGITDQLNSHVGVLRAQLEKDGHSQFDEMLSNIQHELFDLGGELCIPDYKVLKAETIDRLETEMDAFNKDLPKLKEFILPAGSLACSYAHVCRTVSRTAERTMVTLQNRDQNITENAMKYINRLSDWFFIFSRVVSRLDGGKEVLWNRQT